MMIKRFLPICLAVAVAAAAITSCARNPQRSAGPAMKLEPPKKSQPRAQALSHFLAATIHERRGEMDYALDQMRLASDLEPDSSLLTLRLIRGYVRNQDFENARGMAERAVVQLPDNANLHIVLGEIYHQLDLYEKAVEAFQEAIRIDPENVLGYGALVSIEEKANDLVAALDIYERLAELTPDSAGVHFQLGLCMVRINDGPNALPSLKRALELNPNLVRARLLMGAIYLEMGKNEEAADHLREYIESSRIGDADGAREQLAAAFARMGRYDESIEQLNLLIASPAEEDRHHIERLYVLLRAGRPAEALETVLPEHTPVMGAFFRALARKKNGDPFDAAFKALDNIEGDVYYEIDLFLNDLLYLFAKNDAGKFLQIELNELRRSGVRSRVADLLLGRTLMGLGDYEEAIPVLLDLVDDEQPDESLHYFLATCHERLDQIQEAEHHLKACLRINPDNPDVLNFLGYMYAVSGVKLEEAEALLVRALEMDPKNSFYLDSLGWIYYKMGDADRALELLRKAIRLHDNDDAELRDHLGDIYLMKGDVERALAEWRRAHRLDQKLEGVKEKIEKHTK